MNRNVPNIISVSRIILSLSLFFIEPMCIPFIIIYVVAFVTDILDGNLARRTGTTSELGKRLDSIGDLVFVFAILFLIVPWMKPDLWLLILSAVVAVFRLIPQIVIGVVTGEYVTFHTKWSKAATGLLFLLPFFSYVIGQYALLIPLTCIVISSCYEYPRMHQYCKENCRY